MSNETTASTICADLHNVLYRLDLQSADSWQIRVDMAKCILSCHGVKFNGVLSIFYFFDNCRAFNFSELEFEVFASHHLDFASWQAMQKARELFKEANTCIDNIEKLMPKKVEVFGEVLKEAMKDFTISFVSEPPYIEASGNCYTATGIAEPIEGATLITPVKE